jgi:hypothetical protein
MPQLVNIAKLLLMQTNIPLGCKSRRWRPVLFKWLINHLEQGFPWVEEIQLKHDGEVD